MWRRRPRVAYRTFAALTAVVALAACSGTAAPPSTTPPVRVTATSDPMRPASPGYRILDLDDATLSRPLDLQVSSGSRWLRVGRVISAARADAGTPLAAVAGTVAPHATVFSGGLAPVLDSMSNTTAGKADARQRRPRCRTDPENAEDTFGLTPTLEAFRVEAARSG